MNVKYIVDGEILKSFYWSNMNTRNAIEIIYRKKRIIKKLFKKNNKQYFLWNKKKININDFISPSIQDIIDNKENMFEDDFWACIMKNNKNIAFITELYELEPTIPYFPFLIASSREKQVKCILSDERYKKEDWSYKVTLTPEDENMKNLFANKHYYLSDLWSLIKRGDVQIIKNN